MQTKCSTITLQDHFAEVCSSYLGHGGPIDRIICRLIDLLQAYELKRMKHRYFRHYQKLPVSHRQDIGLDNPQVQKQMLGQYFSDETTNTTQRISGSWWAR